VKLHRVYREDAAVRTRAMERMHAVLDSAVNGRPFVEFVRDRDPDGERTADVVTVCPYALGAMTSQGMTDATVTPATGDPAHG